MTINSFIYLTSIYSSIPSIHLSMHASIGGSLDNVLRYHIWEQEACIKLCTLQSQRSGMIVETITGVLDVKDMTLGQINRDFLGR